MQEYFTRDDMDALFNYMQEQYKNSIVIDPEWSELLSQDRIDVTLEVLRQTVTKSFMNNLLVETTGAMRWGVTFHQECMVDYKGDIR